jgi:hypothetical protein
MTKKTYFQQAQTTIYMWYFIVLEHPCWFRKQPPSLMMVVVVGEKLLYGRVTRVSHAPPLPQNKHHFRSLELATFH